MTSYFTIGSSRFILSDIAKARVLETTLAERVVLKG